MKAWNVLMVFSLFFLVACNKEKTPRNLEKYVVQYVSPEICCANLWLLGGQQVFGDNVGYSSESLAAVNMDPFVADQNIKNGDTLQVEFVFTIQQYPCSIICNRLDGIPIEVFNVKPVN